MTSHRSPKAVSNQCSLLLVAFASLGPATVPVVAQPLQGTGPEVHTTCGNDAPRFGDIARLVAPVFWFSPDEPLLGHLPQRMPSAAPRLPMALPDPGNHAAPGSLPGTVYYRVTHAQALGVGYVADNHPDLLALENGGFLAPKMVPLAALTRFRIRYYAYYSADIGFGEHEDDVEIVDIDFQIDTVTNPRTQVDCFAIRVSRIVGAAHGLDWYSNVLDVEQGRAYDVLLPPRVLVEEGKHASAPDRNGDGWFTPGYDVSRHRNDAWGVRDTLRAPQYSVRVYAATFAKDRCSRPFFAVHEQYRELWRANPVVGISECLTAHVAAGDWESRVFPYVLREAVEMRDYCYGGEVRPMPRSQGQLRDLLDKWGFCGRTSVHEETNDLREWIGRYFGAGRWGPDGTGYTRRLSGGWRILDAADEATTHSLAFVLAAKDVGTGWIVPRLVFNPGAPRARRADVEILYTPSASRFLDWYVIGRRGGAGKLLVLPEIGLRLRFPVGASLLRVGFGYRLGLSDPKDNRLVFELGLGAW